MTQVKTLSAELQKIAIEELGEVPTRIPHDLEALKTWIRQQPHLKARTDDQFLIQFLRGCKFSLEKAKAKLDSFYTFKTKYPEFVGTMAVDSPKFRAIHNLGWILALPTPLNDHGPRILMFRVIHPTDKYNFEEVLEPCNALQEMLIMNDPYACICGLMYVVDMAQVTIQHILQSTPAFVKKLATFYEKSLPLRIKAICYINVPTMAEQFFKLLLPCLTEKLRQRVYIYGKNMAKLTAEHIPQKYLPQEYGGENGCLQQLTEDYHKVWDANREYFKQNAAHGTDERLRPGKPIDLVDGVCGLPGSFRKLNVD